MGNMIYGHTPPFGPVTNEQELDEMNSALLDAKSKSLAAALDYVARLPVPEHDMVNNPGHYTYGNIECIDYIKDVLTKEEFIGYLRGCMIKYQHRLRNKGDSAENAGKMKWYNDRLIKELEK